MASDFVERLAARIYVGLVVGHATSDENVNPSYRDDAIEAVCAAETFARYLKDIEDEDQ